MEKGSIVDVYPEGSPAYRGCVLEAKNKLGLVYVVNLNSGARGYEDHSEIVPTTITSIFMVE